jgi:hypothetical protein
MSQLTWGTIPGFFDLNDSVLDPDQPVTDDLLKKINHNAKGAAVREEIFGPYYFQHGNTVALPTSPVDGYAYARAELKYIWCEYSNRAPGGGFSPGQSTPPTTASNNAGAGYVYYTERHVDRTTGVVSLVTHYHVEGGATTVTNDGTVAVLVVARRSSIVD